MKKARDKKIMFRNKKGIEVQFNWIFILVVGALVIFLFSRMILMQKQSSEASVAVMLRSKFQSFMVSSITNEDLSSEVNFQTNEMSFGCDGFSVAGRKTAPVDVGVSFAQKLISTESGNLVVRTQVWSMPFKISNFIYITSPEVMYIFVDNGEDKELLNEIYAKMPEKMSKMQVSSREVGHTITNSQNYNIRIILFEEEADADVLIKDLRKKSNKVSALNIIPVKSSAYAFDAGILTFYTASSQQDSAYLGTASLMGAIFSDDAETYSCNMAKAFDKLSGMIDLYSERINLIQAEYNKKAEYDKINDQPAKLCTSCLNMIAGYLQTLKTDVSSKKISDFTEDKITNSLIPLLKTIDDKNRLLIRNSCPEIY